MQHFSDFFLTSLNWNVRTLRGSSSSAVYSKVATSAVDNWLFQRLKRLYHLLLSKAYQALQVASLEHELVHGFINLGSSRKLRYTIHEGTLRLPFTTGLWDLIQTKSGANLMFYTYLSTIVCFQFLIKLLNTSIHLPPPHQHWSTSYTINKLAASIAFPFVSESCCSTCRSKGTGIFYAFVFLLFEWILSSCELQALTFCW